MLVEQRFGLRRILGVSTLRLFLLSLWAVVALVIYKYLNIKWVAVPWLPMSLVGTALAFYVGFKNNSSYARVWEARKIWGAIVNTSRSWATMCKHLITPSTSQKKGVNKGIDDVKRRLIYRHIAWLYILRKRLLAPRSWEHYNDDINQQLDINWLRTKLKKDFEKESLETILTRLLSKEEMEHYFTVANGNTQLLDKQTEELADCHKAGWLNDFQHMELQRLITDLYTQQGKCERIKNFPFPRLYASASYWFVYIFIFFLPFSMIRSFLEMGPSRIWIVIPFSAIVGWVFLTMESIGDYSEHPFQGLMNDIPMKSICRGIEIDLREMLSETELPPAIEAVDGILM